MTNKQMVDFTVNGDHVSLSVKPGQSLAELLREELRLTGTKIGCSEAECGSCTVVIDGKPVLSCAFPALRAQGKNVLTIEGLSKLDGNGDTLHPLQQAFVLYGAVQCGFCIPGMLMTAYALLERNPDPTRDEVHHALKHTFCRCAGYPTIEKAVLAAAKAMRNGEPVELPELPESKWAEQVVGRVHVRPEAVAKVTGRALFTDDLKLEDMAYGRAKRADIPHAIVKSLDVSRAKSLPGVLAVLTAEDIPGDHYHGTIIRDWPSIVGVGEKIRYVGDVVALVAAESNEIATQALELIDVGYEALPIVSNPVQAHESGAVQVHDKGNLLKHIKVRKGDIDHGMEGADVIMEHTFHTATYDHAFLEPECSIAQLTLDARMEVFVGSQIAYEDREMVALALGWPEERVRVIGMLVGGGFGGKEDITGQIHAALLCNAIKRPVKVLYDRHESISYDVKRHTTQIRVKVGAKNNGKLVAVETELYGDTGAYASLGEAVMTRATTHSSGPYEMPHVKGDCFAMYTNNIPAGAYRGFGVMQSAFGVETMMDMMAEELEIDPFEIRRMNALHVGSVTNTGQILNESVGLLECIDRVEDEVKRLAGDTPFVSHPVPGEPNKRRSWGIAAAYKNTGLGGGVPDEAGATVELFEDGTVESRTSSAEIGQGLVTVLQIITAEELGMPIEKVRVLLSDTDLTPNGGPTTASRQTFMSGNAVRYAARVLRDALVSEVAEKYDISPKLIQFKDGCIHANGHTVELSELAQEMKQKGLDLRAKYLYSAPETKPLGEGGDMHFAFSFAVQAAEVEVDTLTGEVAVLNVIAANDVGAAINPLGLQVQVEGGVVMGVGHALTEKFIMDEGRVVTDRLAMYRMPNISQTPEITSIVVEEKVAAGPYGAKGVGEVVLVPTSPAITNAIYNAVGVRFFEIPVDQEIIARQIAAKS
ncbi:MAG: molybdopterin-dependent oxidoreductase [Anaerolineaceae bacterium]|nr:molybdopterin-dependent oxidoreductase [Anaerolineaceae bacterium]